jgi:hypothetical protein
MTRRFRTPQEVPVPSRPASSIPACIALLLGCGALALFPENGAGQGCAPARIAGVFPGTEGDIYLRRGTWQVGLAVRSLRSSRLIQGHTDMGPSSVVTNTVGFPSLTYGLSDRVAIAVTVPVGRGTHETLYPDQQRHRNAATGIGDISVTASAWLLSASPLRTGGNLGFGAGLKLPTGRNAVEGRWWNADGTAISFPVHQSIEPGDGSWGLIARVHGFQPLAAGVYAYGGAVYTASLLGVTDVPRTPDSTQFWAAPDTWEASAGVAWAVRPEQGFSARLGFVFSGTTRRDLIGDTDSREHRLPATAGYLEPGLTLTRGPHTWTLGLATRIYKNFMPSVWDEAAGKKGGGGLAKFLVQGGYVLRI